MKWHVGDRAEIIKSDARPELLGEHVTITGFVSNGCEVDIPIDSNMRLVGPHGGLCYSHDALKSIPYDGNQASTWKDCIWQPQELVMCRT